MAAADLNGKGGLLGEEVELMHSRRFDTVLGRIGFDEKGDVTGFEPWQMVRLAGGRELRAAGAKPLTHALPAPAGGN